MPCGEGYGQGERRGQEAVPTALWVTQCGKETHAYKSYGNYKVKLEGKNFARLWRRKRDKPNNA